MNRNKIVNLFCYSGVVVLSSTDCSSCSSSGCSGHSDITEPGSPYSSPGPGGASPEPGSGDEEARPPDPGWPPFTEEAARRKRPYPWKGVIAASTPKRMRIDDVKRPPAQKQWQLLDAKGQIKITEYFKTQVKAKSAFKKELDIKLFPAQVKNSFRTF